jgi:hypothetical protein
VRTPHQCPSCGKPLQVTVMKCAGCGASLEGSFELCPVCRFDPELQSLFDLFMTSRGNLKEVERKMNCSYPTVRSRMEEMFRRYEESKPPRLSRLDILKRLRKGEITAADAERSLREGE